LFIYYSWRNICMITATFKQIKLKPGLKRPKHQSLNFIFKSRKYRPTLQAQDLGRWAWCSLPSFYTHTFGKPCFYIYIYIKKDMFSSKYEELTEREFWLKKHVFSLLNLIILMNIYLNCFEFFIQIIILLIKKIHSCVKKSK
jgi:hypothetical protein